MGVAVTPTLHMGVRLTVSYMPLGYPTKTTSSIASSPSNASLLGIRVLGMALVYTGLPAVWKPLMIGAIGMMAMSVSGSGWPNQRGPKSFSPMVGLSPIFGWSASAIVKKRRP